MSAPRSEHYSYAVYADPAMAASFEGRRFSGPIGQLIATSQEAVIARFLAPIGGRTILDVGTGTGRAAIALARRGAVVTGVDASMEMLAVARTRAADQHADVSFIHGDAHGLAFDDGAFDAVVCLRVLMHTPDWRQSLGELCRVARHRVVFDYPAPVQRRGDPGADSPGRGRGRVRGRGLPGIQRSLGDRSARRAWLPGRRPASPVRAADRVP